MLIRLVALNARFVHSAPALFYLREAVASRLPAARVEIVQLTINDPYYETLLRLLDGEPGALLFSVYVWNADFTRRLLADLAQVRPELPVVVGGPQAPHLDLPARPGLSVVRGPVEGLAAGFYADLAAGRPGPEYQADPQAPFAMPYRREDCAAGLQNRHIYYESSRGCPFNCSYCLSAVRRGVTALPLEQVFRELELLLGCHPPVIRFVDRTFNAPPERALAIWRFLAIQNAAAVAAGKPATLFHFEIAPDLFTDEALDWLATVPSGLFQFEIGLQSFNPASLAAVNRNPDLERATIAISRLRTAGNIHLHLDLILGLPFEERATYLRSLNAILALKPQQLQLGLLKVLPDTPLARRREEFGLRCCQAPPYPVLATRWLNQGELAELYRLGEVIEAFYNPRYFHATIAYLLRREPDPAAFFRELAAVCRRRHFFERARTQELLSELLVNCCRSRPDAELLAELQRFDWLACGHRRLPVHLLPTLPESDGAPDLAGSAWLKEVQDRLWRRLPDNYPPLFTPRTRSAFFKRGVFAPFSAVALGELNLGDGRRAGTVVFLPEKASDSDGRQNTFLFSDDE